MATRDQYQQQTHTTKPLIVMLNGEDQKPQIRHNYKQNNTGTSDKLQLGRA